MPKVDWPVVVLSSNDRFLHVCRDAAGLREHIAADLADGFAPPGGGRRGAALEFYDVGGQLLRPIVSPQWTVDGFEPTGERAGEQDLLRRMESALRTAERIDRRQQAAVLEAEGLSHEDARRAAGRERRRAPRTQNGLDEQARLILAELDDQAPAAATALNRGGWLHSAWHAAFG